MPIERRRAHVIQMRSADVNHNMTNSALIIGGGSGVGRALAGRLAAAGRRVVVAGRTQSTLDATAAETGARAVVADVARPETLDAAIAAATGEGPLKALAYCVGSILLKPFDKTSADEMIETYRLNVVGAVETLRRARPALAEAEGAVVLFSTVAAAQGFPNHSAIAPAKAAIEGLARTLAAEWAPKIRVNVVAPSLSRTPMAAFMTDNAPMAKAIAALHPLPRLGEAADAAAAAAFLLSDDASWITGQVVGVDGGRSTLRHKN